MYLTPVKKFEPFSCGMWWDIRILKVFLYPLYSSFKTLKSWVIRINTGVQELPTQILSLYLLSFFDYKHQKPILVKPILVKEREFITAILGSSKWQSIVKPGLESAQRLVSTWPAMGVKDTGQPWPSLQDTPQEQVNANCLLYSCKTWL